MRFSGMKDALLHKYHNGEDPKKQMRRQTANRVFYLCTAVMVITSVILQIVSGRSLPVGPGEEPVSPWATPLVLNEKDEMGTFMDYSADVHLLPTDKKRVNQPSVYGSEVLFSAGEGSLEEPVFTALYLFNTQTGELSKVATSKLGEIYETYLSNDWIVWVDTDNAGTNAIYKLDRTNPDAAPIKIQTTENHVPKLALYGDYLIWMEQESDTEDQLYFVYLDTDENMALEYFDQTNYAVSSPFIFKNTVIWAADDPKDDQGSNSAIFSVEFDDLGTVSQEDPYKEDSDSGEMKVNTFSTGTYVHEPLCNDDVYVWIDKNKAPDSNLYYTYKDGSTGSAILLHRNVTSYAIGHDFVVYCFNQIIYAYFYKTDTLLQVSESGCYAMLPQAFGSLVIWEDKTGGTAQDVFKYNMVE